MSDAEGAVIQPGDRFGAGSTAPPPTDDWVARLRFNGPVRDDAISNLHALMLRAARQQVSRMPESIGLGSARRDEAIQSAANEATVAVLQRLETFEGRSRFTTWAYRFAILYAGVEVRRAAWSSREIHLHEIPEALDTKSSSPEQFSEANALARAVRIGMLEVLTPHQRRVAVALLVDDVPIDVLAERLGTTRSALYKTLHDARRRLRTHLTNEGFLTREASQGGSRNA